MANKGRRMVFEEDIKKIGEGGGATYTAGANISISEDNVISATDTTYTASNGVKLVNNDIQADTSVMATNAYAQTAAAQAAEGAVRNYNVVPQAIINWVNDPNMIVDDVNKTVDISYAINQMPLLKTNSCTKFNTYSNPKYERTTDDGQPLYMTGQFLLIDDTHADDAQDPYTNYIIVNLTSNQSVRVGDVNATRYQTRAVLRAGNNDYIVANTRCGKRQLLYRKDDWADYSYIINGTTVDKSNIVQICLTNTGQQDTTVSSDITKQYATMKLNYQLPVDSAHESYGGNYPNYNISAPAAAASTTYVLKASFDADSKFTGFAWVAEV